MGQDVMGDPPGEKKKKPVWANKLKVTRTPLCLAEARF